MGAFDFVGEHCGEVNAAPLDAHEAKRFDAVVPEDDVLGHLRDRALDGLRIHDLLAGVVPVSHGSKR